MVDIWSMGPLPCPLGHHVPANLKIPGKNERQHTTLSARRMRGAMRGARGAVRSPGVEASAGPEASKTQLRVLQRRRRCGERAQGAGDGLWGQYSRVEENGRRNEGKPREDSLQIQFV